MSLDLQQQLRQQNNLKSIYNVLLVFSLGLLAYAFFGPGGSDGLSARSTLVQAAGSLVLLLVTWVSIQRTDRQIELSQQQIALAQEQVRVGQLQADAALDQAKAIQDQIILTREQIKAAQEQVKSANELLSLELKHHLLVKFDTEFRLVFVNLSKHTIHIHQVEVRAPSLSGSTHLVELPSMTLQGGEHTKYTRFNADLSEKMKFFHQGDPLTDEDLRKIEGVLDFKVDVDYYYSMTSETLFTKKYQSTMLNRSGGHSNHIYLKLEEEGYWDPEVGFISKDEW